MCTYKRAEPRRCIQNADDRISIESQQKQETNNSGKNFTGYQWCRRSSSKDYKWHDVLSLFWQVAFISLHILLKRGKFDYLIVRRLVINIISWLWTQAVITFCLVWHVRRLVCVAAMIKVQYTLDWHLEGYQFCACVRNVWGINRVFTALHWMQTRSSDENSVCLSVKRVDCDKTEEWSVQIFIPYERSFRWRVRYGRSAVRAQPCNC